MEMTVKAVADNKPNRQTSFAAGARETATSAPPGRHTPTQTGGTGLGRGCPSVPACACVLPPPPGPLLPLPPITAPLRTRLVEGAERSLACPAPRDKNTAWLPAGTVRRSPPGLVGGRRRRGNAALPDPPSPPPPPAVRRPGGSAAWASPAAQPPPSPPPTHVRALLPSSVPPPALLHRPLAKPSRPIGSTTGGGGVLPFRGPHLGFWPASVFCACAESALRELHSSLESSLRNRIPCRSQNFLTLKSRATGYNTTTLRHLKHTKENKMN
ncbi:sterile alpha motif domain-containing protein 1-like [Bos javanicus]|uniref:sterile alpha motif domain-containing protein 1-like n=1 Tax=Bos javanicus TaxID=9906 RepID=UPI002AA776DB|nr:sterile alpha motif domain-containing protein 1-like [Bos javanicus]